jgi:phage-related protein
MDIIATVVEVLYVREVRRFIVSCPKKVKTKILKSVDLLEKYGYLLKMPHRKQLGKNLYELRIRGNPEIRLFYKFSNQKAVVLYHYVKKEQKLPRNVLNEVLKRARQI